MAFTITQDLDVLPRVAACEAPTDLRDLVAAETPMVIRGMLDHWPALAAGKHSPGRLNAYIKSMDIGAPAPLMEAPASSHGWYFYAPDLREFNFSKRQARISETLDRMERLLNDAQAPFLAIQMLPLATHLPQFVRENPSPLLPLQVMPRLWMGGPLRTQTHNDRDHN
ncbi:MAG TPA: cupin-like domain-containing protein, partial [Povalibacter sp.]|nr:cupin-like domain-containing protein [Povalibacter sp.]